MCITIPLLAAGACSPAAGSGSSDDCLHAPDPASCDSDFYFRSFAGNVPACLPPASTTDRLDGTVTVDLFAGTGVDDAQVAEQSRHLQRFFAPYGLSFLADRPASDAQLAFAMRGTQADLDAALTAAGIPTDRDLTPDEQGAANRAIGGVMFADLRGFVARAAADARSGVINLVILDHVMDPALALAFFGSSGAFISGFGLSVSFLARLAADDPDRALADMIGLPAEFPPIAIVGRLDIARGGGSPDNVVAHEMGHALGLPHEVQPDNLLTPGPPPACEAALSNEQIDELRPAVSVTASALRADQAIFAVTPAQLVEGILRRRQARR